MKEVTESKSDCEKEQKADFELKDAKENSKHVIFQQKISRELV